MYGGKSRKSKCIFGVEFRACYVGTELSKPRLSIGLDVEKDSVLAFNYAVIALNNGTSIPKKVGDGEAPICSNVGAILSIMPDAREI